MRIQHHQYRTYPKDSDSLVVRKRGGGERIIPAGKWWINGFTPVGEDAEWWERKPHGGRKSLDPHKDVLAYLREE